MNPTFGSNQKYGIKDFYKGSHVFITGGTGFLGRVLVEKILRSCNVKEVYLLIRDKRNLTSQERYEKYLNHQIFDRIKAECPNELKKIVPISGDLMKPNLGINDSALKLVMESTNIVFHSAATVNFTESLDTATYMNICATEKLLKMCIKMKKLKSFVHVSTAFCIPGPKVVKEVVYPVDCTVERDVLIEAIKSKYKDELSEMFNEIKGNHTNTYTLTKSIAEELVAEFHKNWSLPSAIVRPSIISASLSEPFPGWTDNIQAVNGMIIEAGRGSFHTIMGHEKNISAMAPADAVVNTLIAAGWTISKELSQSEQLPVFNCTTGKWSPISFGLMRDVTMKWFRQNPTKYQMMYPFCSFRMNRVIHKILIILLTYFPAILYDVAMKIVGMKPINLKTCMKSQAMLASVEAFTTSQLIYENTNLKGLIKEINICGEDDVFGIHLENMDCELYMENYVKGIQKYVLRDDDESIRRARLKIRIFLWIRMMVAILFLGYIFSEMGGGVWKHLEYVN